MALISINIDFRKYYSHPQLVADLAPAFNAQPGDEVNITIVLQTYYRLLYADFLLLVVSLINHLKQNGIKVSGLVNADENDEKVKYASRLNFFQQIGLKFPESFVRHSGTGRFTEIKTFDAESIYSLQDQLNIILYENSDISREVLQLLYYCLNEIMDNVLVHSKLNNGWVCAQFFRRGKEIRLIICDTGDGIHRSLTTNPKSKYPNITEQEALNLCIQRGVTNGEGFGFGLFVTSQFIKENGGELLVYSGNHFLRNVGRNYEVVEGPKWQGTVVFLKINTDIAVDYQLVMPEGHSLPNDYQEFIEKHLGLDNNLW